LLDVALTVYPVVGVPNVPIPAPVPMSTIAAELLLVAVVLKATAVDELSAVPDAT
jgi:hypothetical protein